jgi:uncharacterized protein
MKIDLKQLKLQPQQSEHYSFVEFWPDELVRGLGAQFAEPVQVDIEVVFTGQTYVGTGKVKSKLVLACSRCLEPSVIQVAEELGITMIDAGSRKPEEFKDDVLVVDQGEADIEPAVIEAIFAVIPLSPLCNSECQGLCPGCGVNKNVEACRCSEENIDPRWEALKKLTQEGGEQIGRS